jgi:hypothetical protein
MYIHTHTPFVFFTLLYMVEIGGVRVKNLFDCLET